MDLAKRILKQMYQSGVVLTEGDIEGEGMRVYRALSEGDIEEKGQEAVET